MAVFIRGLPITSFLNDINLAVVENSLASMYAETMYELAISASETFVDVGGSDNYSNSISLMDDDGSFVNKILL